MLEELRCIIQDALDDLCSPRASFDVTARALERLERQMVGSCFSDQGESRKSWDHFLALQYTFECNIPSRLITWISASTVKLEQITSLAVPDGEHTLTSQLSRALSIIQGIALSHDSSKVYLGRKCSLEVLLVLLLASRHLTLQTASADDERSRSAHNEHLTNLPLTSTVLDTLLCILVDSPQALRVFENIHGIQAVVKILKRAGTPREVRMKCLEFLYFYLLDETAPTEAISSQRFASPLSATSSVVPPLAVPPVQKPGTRLPKPSLNSTPLRPLSRHGSGSSSGTSSSSRSTSGSSTHSFTSVSSISTSATPVSSIPPSPEKAPMQTSQSQINPRMLFQTPPSTLKFSVPQTLPRDDMMMMLRKDVDYEPLSPKKPGFGMGTSERERVSTPNSRSRPRAQTHGHSYTPSRSYTQSSQLSSAWEKSEFCDGKGSWKRKTTEEKKQLLGTMLGNVDALVEGVRKAGIWGLG